MRDVNVYVTLRYNTLRYVTVDLLSSGVARGSAAMAFFIQKILIFAAITTFAAADPGELTLKAQFIITSHSVGTTSKRFQVCKLFW